MWPLKKRVLVVQVMLPRYAGLARMRRRRANVRTYLDQVNADDARRARIMRRQPDKLARLAAELAALDNALSEGGA